MSIHSYIGFIYYIVVGAGHVRPLHGSKKGRPVRTAFCLLCFCFSRQAQQHQHQKDAANPSASHSVKGEPSTSVLMMAAVTGSAKL